MEKSELLKDLKDKKPVDFYTGKAYRDLAAIPLLLVIMETEKSAAKYQAEKVIRQISEERPELLVPYFERIVRLLESPNTFIKWGVILTIPNLLQTIRPHQWQQTREKYLASLKSQNVAEFGNIVSCIKKILNVYPEEEHGIIPILLQIDGRMFLHQGEASPECLNVAKGHILDCFAAIYDRSVFKREMLAFADQNKENPRNQVRIKANRLLK
jgi:hypothetical protein